MNSKKKTRSKETVRVGTSKGPFVIHNHKHVAKQLAVTIDYRSILTPPQQIMFEKILRIGKGAH